METAEFYNAKADWEKILSQLKENVERLQTLYNLTLEKEYQIKKELSLIRDNLSEGREAYFTAYISERAAEASSRT